MPISMTVGGRTIVAAGTVVLLRNDNFAELSIDDLRYRFSFEKPDGVAGVRFEQPDPKSIFFFFTGPLNLGTSWEAKNIATWNAQHLHMSLLLFGVQAAEITRSIQYTVTSTPAPLA